MILNYNAAQKRRDQQGIKNNLLESILHDIKQENGNELLIAPHRPLNYYEVGALNEADFKVELTNNGTKYKITWPKPLN